MASFAGIPSDGTLVTLTFQVLEDGLHEVVLNQPGELSPLWPSAEDFGTFIQPVYQKGLVATDAVPFPALSLTDAIDSDTVTLGEVATIPVTIGNIGTASLEVFGLAFAYNPGNEFVISNDPCSGQALLPSQSCIVTVSYAVDEIPFGGIASARLVVTTSDLVTPGEWPAHIEELYLTTEYPRDVFRLVRDECTGVSLGVGQLCEVDLQTTHTEPQRAFANLNVRHNGNSFAPRFAVVCDNCSNASLDVGDFCAVDVEINSNAIGVYDQAV